MKFAENNRISHRQLYRQIVLTFTAPFLLSLFGREKINGVTGIFAVVAVAVFLGFYVLFLLRQESCYMDLKKYTGVVGAKLIGAFFLVYIVFTAAYLLKLLGEIVPETLVTDVSSPWLIFWALLACSVGTHKGMQRRGREADVMGGLFLFIMIVILILCIGQGKRAYLEEMLALYEWDIETFGQSFYGILCAFSGLSLLPFLLEYVEKPGSAWKSVMGGIYTISAILTALFVLLPAIFGWNRVFTEKYPILPLFAGADLPGNVLARFDVLWMGFLLFSLLFSIGSLLHYGYLVMEKTNFLAGKYWLSAAVFVLAVGRLEGYGIEDIYGKYLAYVFVPVLIVIQFLVWFMGKERRKKRVAATAVCLVLTLPVSFFLSGCGGVEPEKRKYPLAMGVDFSEGNYVVTYGMADLVEATGQEKPEENGDDANVLTIQGATFGEIEEVYNQSQEKYLDLGHLEVLVLGKNMLGDKKWKMLLQYLKEEPFVGENIYVFQTENAAELLSWRNKEDTSLGEYVMGIMKNRVSGQQRNGVTLRDLFYQAAKEEALPILPYIIREEQGVCIAWTLEPKI